MSSCFFKKIDQRHLIKMMITTRQNTNIRGSRRIGISGRENRGQRKSNKGKGDDVGGFLTGSTNSRETREIEEERATEPE